MPISSEEIDRVIETLETATEENKVSSLRVAQVVHLPPEGEVWVTGDLHDHRRNFEKFVAAADLPNNPRRHIILHEIIHGEHFDENRAEDSWRMLVKAAALKCDYSSQVHFLFANHDLAQIHGEGIMKAGQSVCEAFNAGVKRDFGSRRYVVHTAITELLLSFPLAIRSPNGLWFSHSIPSDDQIAAYDYGVFDRDLTGEDYRRRVGPVYQLVWGRKASPESAAVFADHVGARLLITGHQPQESGYAVNGDRHLIIASDHNQGVFVPLSLSETYDMDAVVGSIQKFVSLAMPEPEEQGVIVLDGETGGETSPEAGGETVVDSGIAAEAPQIVRTEPLESAEAGTAMAGGADAAGGVAEPPAAPASAQAPAEGAGADAAASPGDPLPSEGQRAALCQMIANALFEIRTLATAGRAAQAADLAGVFQGLPTEMFGWGRWDRAAFRGMLESYQQAYPPAEGQEQVDYVAWFDQIMSTDESLAATAG